MGAIEGLDKLISKLNNIASDKDIAKGLEKACIRVEVAAKENAPVDDGQLRASITHKVNGASGEVGTNVEYAPYVEYGTGIFASKGDGRKDKWSYQDAEGKWHKTVGQHPKPFLAKALDSNIDKVKEEIAKAIKEGLR